ncbi:hypothetical protein FGL98_08780 [Leekyejoonella antrihumi]|uniref:Tr-type G domain-containing protein n=1 Tax=Leekyejoonella antrihumi TaxID=1660198 RepID=A0A563E3F3_9MICO|nr:hypothetical protein FGL98_08780 [Leekyejoonella antrihumi]
MRTLNVGVLAHVDAGKTSLTERLLFATGTLEHLGSVDTGTTRTGSMDLERALTTFTAPPERVGGRPVHRHRAREPQRGRSSSAP